MSFNVYTDIANPSDEFTAALHELAEQHYAHVQMFDSRLSDIEIIKLADQNHILISQYSSDVELFRAATGLAIVHAEINEVESLDELDELLERYTIERVEVVDGENNE